MNYKKLYSNIISRGKDRKQQQGYEKHHIIPDFMFLERKRSGPKGHLPGNPNSKDNTVYLTFKEHFICHLLLRKILHKTRYSISAYTSLLLMINPPKQKSNISTKNILLDRNDYFSSKKYTLLRQKINEALSKERTGTMLMFDSITREYVGRFSTEHENFKDGTWCHHTKGKIYTPKQLEKARLAMSGEGNSRFSGITNEEFEKEWIILSTKLGYQPSFNFFRKVYFEKTKVEFPKTLTIFRFNKGKDLIIKVEKEFGLTQLSRFIKNHWNKLEPKDYI